MAPVRSFRYWKTYRTFGKLPASERRIVFYSESTQDWHHFAPLVDCLTRDLSRQICFVSSAEDDPGLHQTNDNILPFCIGPGTVRTLFFQTLKADVMVMTMIDLDNLQLKRSVHNVHYVFMFHSLISTHMTDHDNSYDHYDTILCAGPHQKKEIEKREQMLGLKPKRLLDHGYARLEKLYKRAYTENPHGDREEKLHVLLAPSWGEEMILHACGTELIACLLENGFRVTLRPHYQTRVLHEELLENIIARFERNPDFTLIEHMGEENSLFNSDVMISDWSGAAIDYALGLGKPVVYLDVPLKARNDWWPELGIEPFESYIRERTGTILSPRDLGSLPKVIRDLLDKPEQFRDKIETLRKEWAYNFGHSGEAGAKHIARIADEIAASAPTSQSL